MTGVASYGQMYLYVFLPNLLPGMSAFVKKLLELVMFVQT